MRHNLNNLTEKEINTIAMVDTLGNVGCSIDQKVGINNPIGISNFSDPYARARTMDPIGHFAFWENYSNNLDYSFL